MKSILNICVYLITLPSLTFAMESNLEQKQTEAPVFITTTKKRLKRERPLAPVFIKTTQRSYKKIRRVFTTAAIQERLHEYNYFLNHSPFLEKVADKELTALQIAEEFYDANKAYLAFLQEQKWSPIALEGTILFNNEIIPLLLQEYKEEMTLLILLGWQKPTN